MTSRGIGDLVSGVVAVLFGCGVLLYVRGFPSLPDGAPGPALFPGIIGALFVLFGLALLVQWERARRARARSADIANAGTEGAETLPRPSRRQVLGGVAIVAAVLIYLAVVDVVGFPVTMAALLFALMVLLGVRLVVAAASAVTTTAVIVLLFQTVLLVPLPSGPLG